VAKNKQEKEKQGASSKQLQEPYDTLVFNASFRKRWSTLGSGTMAQVLSRMTRTLQADGAIYHGQLVVTVVEYLQQPFLSVHLAEHIARLPRSRVLSRTPISLLLCKTLHLFLLVFLTHNIHISALVLDVTCNGITRWSNWIRDGQRGLRFHNQTQKVVFYSFSFVGCQQLFI
jgi:hypothetical protein